CHKRYDRDLIQKRISDGDRVPRCDVCNGLLKPATISFGQTMPEKETAEAMHRSAQCDLFIVIGSSLVVQPAASMPLIAKEKGAKLVIINRDDTPYDHLADVRIHDSAGAVLPEILQRVRALS
ncbi:MAG: sigma factor regulator FecR, partial [Deltaproteobacteria bacterium]|nr:sigma factor regulator FecR [Deltaproteobacteria bacterium]